MRRRTKYMIRLWINRGLLLFVLGVIIWANITRLRDNDYSNYEKIIDYGRIKDEDKLVRPVIAAIFYKGKNRVKSSLSTYFNHGDNYKKQNVKMVIVPKQLTTYSAEVVEKLYEEIRHNNTLDKVLLVYDRKSDSYVNSHKKMLSQVINVQKIEEITVSESSLKGESQIDNFLKDTSGLVVFLADLDKGLKDEDSDFLTEEAIYFAQKFFYQMNVFDMIDTQLARGLEKDYETLYPLEAMKDEPLLVKQKRNLERYKHNHWHVLRNYFELNLLHSNQGNETIMPMHTEENYRLYDRGRLILKAFDENYVEIFEKVQMEQNKGIAFLLSDAVKDLVNRGYANKAKYFKIYLLTDLIPVSMVKGTMLVSYLDQDDGIYVEYRNKSALLVADDRPDNPEDLSKEVRDKAQIPENISDEKISYYKFKTVEMDYGD